MSVIAMAAFSTLSPYGRPEAESRLAWLTGGRVYSPVVYVGGEALVQPSIGELGWALSRSGVR